MRRSRASAAITRTPDGAGVDDHHFIDFGFDFTPFEAFVGRHSAGANVEVEKAHAAHVVVIAAVTAQTDSATVAHPEGGFLGLIVVEHAVVVDVVAAWELACVAYKQIS